MVQQGRKETFPYGDRFLSITEILREPGVLEFLESNGPLTDDGQQNKFRRKLRVGTLPTDISNATPRISPTGKKAFG